MTILIIDAGTSSVRASILRESGVIETVGSTTFKVYRPSPGLVEFDAASLASIAVDLAVSAANEHDVRAVAITAQRASTVLWDRKSGAPVAPGLGWQDLRTTGLCLSLQSQGLRLSPNQSATKIVLLLEQIDPGLKRDLCFGTIESWIAWNLSGTKLHVTDATNAAVTGLLSLDASDWDNGVLEKLKVPREMLPEIVDTDAIVGPARLLRGSPPIAALVGDQQASLIGQGCLERGSAKATFGTGAMLDVNLGDLRPSYTVRGDNGTFPIVVSKRSGSINWGAEAVMLSAGSCVEWLVNGLGLFGTVAESDEIAGAVSDTGGVSFVPALSGLGTPLFDFGARGSFFGLHGGTTRAELVPAVLEGIAQRGADLVEAIERDSEMSIETLSIDGGMSENSTFCDLLASAIRRPVVLSREKEATALGAGFIAGVAVGIWPELSAATSTRKARAIVQPTQHLDRDRWLDARSRSLNAIPALSLLHF